MNVELLVDGVRIGLNDFVQRILANIIVGAALSLHGVSEDWKELKVIVKR
ncbi:MAG: hypothetical protein QXK12_01165 [Candidatus Nezhaarchaeales archaeon]